MTTEKKVELRDGGHDFDGIQELDNDLPRWWVNLFLVTIAFGIVYLAWYHFPGSPGLTPEQEYLAEKRKIEGEPAPSSGQNAGSGFDWSAAQKDPNVLAQGKAAFQANCAACHGANGEGLIGPNLTDSSWISKSQSSELLEVILKGVPAKGMPAWEGVIGKKTSQILLAYIGNLQGTNPPNGKPPQGEEKGPIQW